jgi:choline dehydrogenase-like flavoprotein
VVVVGASVAGCTAARLFAPAGARVALIERRDDPAAYKVTCTHAVVSSATPTIERLGLAPLLIERGVPRTWADFWTPYGGWFRTPDDFPDGWGVTRRTLDPMLRDLAVNTSGWSSSRVDGEACPLRSHTRGRRRGRGPQPSSARDPRATCGRDGRAGIDGRAARGSAGTCAAAQSVLLLRLLARDRAGESRSRTFHAAVDPRSRRRGAVPKRG